MTTNRPPIIVSMTDARANLGKLMDQVVQNGEKVIVTKNGFHYVGLEPIAQPEQIEPASLPTQPD